jgi:hypothetical protein
MEKAQLVRCKPALLTTLLLALAAQAHAKGYAVVDAGEAATFTSACDQCGVWTSIFPAAISDSGLVLESLSVQITFPKGGDGANNTRVIDPATQQVLPLAYPKPGRSPNSGDGIATGINASNQIALGNTVIDATGARTFAPPAGTVSAIINGLNASTQLTGYAYDSNSISNGFVTASNMGAATLLGRQVFPVSINAKGQVAGSLTSSNNSDVAFLTNLKGAVVKIGKLVGDTESRAVAINDAGIAIGYSARAASGSVTYRAFVTNVFSLPVNLNKFAPKGYTANWATGINNAGVVVGNGTNAQGVTEPFVYQGSKLSRLNADASITAAGWTLNRVQGINNKGQIVGTATLSSAPNSTPHVVVLNPLP